MKFSLIEKFGRLSKSSKILDEATFSGANHLNMHWKSHVLQDGEEFDFNNPKFPPMTEEEYAKSAEKLSLAKASIVETEEDLKNARGIIGWVSSRPEKYAGTRCVKIDTNSKKHFGFIEIVVYVDDAEHGNQIFTYMLAKRGRKYREFAYKIAELPENEPEESEEVVSTEEVANTESSSQNTET